MKNNRITSCALLLFLLAVVSLCFSSETPTTLRDASLVLKIDDYDAARNQVLRLGGQHNARILGSSTLVNYQGKKQGWLRLAVTAEELNELCHSLRGLGKLYSEKLVASDHTSEVADLARRVGYLRQHEQELIEFLHRPRRMRGSDILYLQERTLTTRFEMGSAIRRQEDLHRASARGRLSVFLFEPEPRRVFDVGNWYAASSLRARRSLFRVLAKSITAGAFAGYFSIFWIPALVVLYLFAKRRLHSLASPLKPEGPAPHDVTPGAPPSVS
ncbi:MAG: DUF4349 domain-containing protein [Armatimonadetes bacterium]|nr:DUF4349 domain-containing protein [Armatimonadota bacterium]